MRRLTVLQTWSPSPCSHTIPRDRASEFILNCASVSLFDTILMALLKHAIRAVQQLWPITVLRNAVLTYYMLN